MICLTEVKERDKAENYLDTRLRELEKERLYRVLPFVLSAVAGFCLSKVDVMGELSPFAGAFLSAVPFRFCGGAFIGSAAGYLSSFSAQHTLRQVLCLGAIALVKLLVHKRFRRLGEGYFFCWLALICVGGAAVLQQIFTGGELVEMLLAVLEGGVALCSAWFYLRSFRLPVRRTGFFNLPVGDRLCLGISAFTLIMCASGVSFEGFSPARLMCFFLMCFASYCKGVPYGSTLGVCLGAALSISVENRFIFPAFALSGLISGAFAPVGQIAVGVSACLTFCGNCVIGGLEENFILPMIECGAAGALFMLVPPAWISRGMEWAEKSGAVSNDCVNLQVSAILRRASANIYSFCKTVDEVSDRLDRVINPEVNKLFFELQQRVCDGCSEKTACWSGNFDSTASDILAIMGIEQKGKGKLQLERICPRFTELKRQIHHGRAQYSLSMLAKTKSRETRHLLTEQFSGMGDFLGELSDKITKSRTVDTVKSMALRSAVIDGGVYVDALSCFGCDEGRLSIEISCFERPGEDDYIRIKNTLESATGRFFDEPDVSFTELGVFIRFDENPPFYLLVGTAQRPFVKDAPCGDSVALCKRSDTCSAVLLSDGMGTGSSAALDSNMAVHLMEKLLSGGFSFESAVKLVNSSLIMKSTDESMATMDGLCVNLYTGEATFYKAGAALSFIRSDREVFAVEESSLPLGILREVSFARQSTVLRSGDIVLMVSDGITAGDCGWLNDELLSWSTNNMEDLAGHIVQLAALRQDALTGDDLTAIAVKLVEK
ncbi:MAG: hypothetical protein E7538_05565 [Ruminococcaceae bacterium]|nr:hypothetical protein [Oscillospiraceae bacterium]